MANDLTRQDWSLRDPNQIMGDNYPLHIAARSMNMPAMLALLIAGADPNAVDKNGDDPVTIAARTRSGDTVELLVRFGCSLFIGTTPLLHWASRYGHISLLNKVRRLGVDVNAVDATGRTAMHMVGHDVPFMLDTIHFLQEGGADLEARDHRGMTPFLYSILTIANPTGCQKWKHSKADLHAVDADGNNAIHLLLTRDRFSTIPEIIRWDVGGDPPTICGFPVDLDHLPSSCGLMLAWLLREGVDVDAVNRWGESGSDLMEERDDDTYLTPEIDIYHLAVDEVTYEFHPEVTPERIHAVRQQIYFNRPLLSRLLSVIH